LLWDDTKGRLNTSKLPPSASRELRDFFLLLDEQQQIQNRTGDDSETKRTAATGDDEELHQRTGQAWFDLLSDLPHCDYLAVSPNGRAFELAPTSESISKALWHVLVGGCNGEPKGTPWTSLDDLAAFWSDLREEQERLRVRHDRLLHRSGFSERSGSSSLVMEHELVSLQLRDSPRAMELRLRCDWQKASGMAAVTHLVKPRTEGLIDPGRVRALRDLCFTTQDCHHETEKTIGAGRDPSLVMLCLALPSDNEPGRPRFPDNDDEDEDDSSAVPDALECLSWLATPYGPDRRELRAESDSDSAKRDEIDEESDHDRRVLAESQLLLKERILQACRVCATHPVSGAHLLSWILQESPIVVESTSSLSSSHLSPRSQQQRQQNSDSTEDAIEKALLALPSSVLENELVLEAIEWNWACRNRGRILVRMIKWKSGKIATRQLLAQSRLHELADMASLAF